jgi:acetyl/propionyl-CoA carboxylase alpha subunit
MSGRFALDDAVAAGAIVARAIETLTARGSTVHLTDAARAALKLHAAYRHPITALRQSASGRLVKELGAGADVELCARVESSTTVPVLQPGTPLRIAVDPSARTPVDHGSWTLTEGASRLKEIENMAVKVIMPQAGQDLETGTVRHWLKAEGDAVVKGQSIVEVETEKITIEVEAPASGVLLKIVVPEDTEAPIFSTIAIIGQPGEDISAIE